MKPSPTSSQRQGREESADAGACDHQTSGTSVANIHDILAPLTDLAATELDRYAALPALVTVDKAGLETAIPALYVRTRGLKNLLKTWMSAEDATHYVLFTQRPSATTRETTVEGMDVGAGPGAAWYPVHEWVMASQTLAWHDHVSPKHVTRRRVSDSSTDDACLMDSDTVDDDLDEIEEEEEEDFQHSFLDDQDEEADLFSSSSMMGDDGATSHGVVDDPRATLVPSITDEFNGKPVVTLPVAHLPSLDALFYFLHSHDEGALHTSLLNLWRGGSVAGRTWMEGLVGNIVALGILDRRLRGVIWSVMEP